MIHLDFETESAVNIRDRGTYVYARHPSTRVKCMAWAVDDGPVRLWYPARFDLTSDWQVQGLLKRVGNGERIAAFNAEFERLIWTHALPKDLEVPPVTFEQMYCVAINAYAMTYGRSMEDVAIQCGALEKKDPKGKKLIQRYCVPWKFDEQGNPIFRNDAEGLLELGEYCKQDVETERAIMAKLEPLSQAELDLYHVDQRINDRGFPVDLELAHASIELAEKAQDRACERLTELTLGAITKPTQRERILEWAGELGYTGKKIGKDDIAQFLASEAAKGASPELVEILELRRDFGRSAHAKFQAAIDRACEDGRVRGSLLMNGARTLRWTGAGVQPQNMKRGLDNPLDQARAIGVVLERDPELAAFLYGDVLELLGDIARGVVKAKPGHELIVSDFSAIEARVLAVIANDEPNLTAFRERRCIYRQMGAVIAGKTYDEISKESEERYLGKQAELAFGYGMGEKTFQARQKLYGREFTLPFCKDVKDKYRALHSAIVRFWRRIESDALRCVSSGQPVTRKWYRFARRAQGLVMIAPNGAQQWYIEPKITMVDKWGSGELQPVLTYSGLANYQWQRLETYGGKLTENLVQFVSRCIQADAVIAAEKAGFNVVIHTHDEIVAHNRIGEKTVEELEQIMGSACSSWARDWPIEAAGGWAGERYRK